MPNVLPAFTTLYLLLSAYFLRQNELLYSYWLYMRISSFLLYSLQAGFHPMHLLVKVINGLLMAQSIVKFKVFFLLELLAAFDPANISLFIEGSRADALTTKQTCQSPMFYFNITAREFLLNSSHIISVLCSKFSNG